MSWNPLNWIGLTSDGQSVDDLAAAERSYQERAAAENLRRVDTGYYTTDQYQAAEQARLLNATDAVAEVGAAAKEGAVEGLKNLPANARGILNTSFNWSFAFIPWWGWLAGLGAIVWYLGGFTYLRGILAKR